MAKEICVVCGIETPYDFETHIDYRIGYVEGVGQLCGQCSRDDNSSSTISIPKSLVKKYPNDMELGEKVRNIYYNGI
jgi:hypothetical protein